jgi:hypothetical protein
MVVTGRARDEAIVESLMIPLAVVMLDELRHRTSEVTLPDRNDPIQTFLDESHEGFCVRIGIRRSLGSQYHPSRRSSAGSQGGRRAP